MSILSDSIKELKEPTKKPSNFKIWLDSLSKEDRNLALESIKDNTIKNHPLFEAFRKSGMKVSKDYFFEARAKIQSGELEDGDIR